MKEPFLFRNGIPFFEQKSEAAFQSDPYERFDPMVLRQSALHLADELWGQYPMQGVIDFTKDYLSNVAPANILEIGCGVGRWIAHLAQQFPDADCWGIDYSYQMLKRANEVWLKGDAIHLNLSRYGFSSSYELQKQALSNLQFGLAKAATLPFADNSQDLVFSSFLFDRLDDPMEGIKEMRRVLKPGGRIFLITPLNFNQSKHWDELYPPIKIFQQITRMGLKILEWQEDIIIEEPLDLRGNAVYWNCLGFICD